MRVPGAPEQVLVTRLSSWAGIVAGPLFLLVSLVGIVANDGFDPFRHAFSFLSLGALGAVQQANFIATGCLYAFASIAVAAAFGGRVGRWVGALLVLLGAGKVVAGVFVIDPAFGFPAGAPDGPAADPSMGSTLHGLGFMVSMAAWLVLLVLLARRFARQGRAGWALAAFGTALALLLVPQLLMAWTYGTVYLYVVLSAAYLLMSLLTRQLAREPAAPDVAVAARGGLESARAGSQSRPQ